jgi:hypothetical protein
MLSVLLIKPLLASVLAIHLTWPLRCLVIQAPPVSLGLAVAVVFAVMTPGRFSDLCASLNEMWTVVLS